MYLPIYVYLALSINFSTYLPTSIPKYQYIIAADPEACIGVVVPCNVCSNYLSLA